MMKRRCVWAASAAVTSASGRMFMSSHGERSPSGAGNVGPSKINSAQHLRPGGAGLRRGADDDVAWTEREPVPAAAVGSDRAVARAWSVWVGHRAILRRQRTMSRPRAGSSRRCSRASGPQGSWIFSRWSRRAKPPAGVKTRGLPAIATGSPRSVVVPRSSLRVRGTRRVTEGPSGIRPGERGSLRRVSVVLFDPVSKAARGYLTPWLGRAEGVTFTSAHVGTGERRTEGLVRLDTGGLPIQGGSGAFSPSSPP